MRVRVPPFAPQNRERNVVQRRNTKQPGTPRLDVGADRRDREAGRRASEEDGAQCAHAGLSSRQGADEADRADLWAAGALRSSRRCRAEIIQRRGEGGEAEGRRLSAYRKKRCFKRKS